MHYVILCIIMTSWHGNTSVSLAIREENQPLLAFARVMVCFLIHRASDIFFADSLNSKTVEQILDFPVIQDTSGPFY